MFDHLVSGLGLVAAGLTSLSYIPQLKKASARGATHDISVGTFCALGVGLLLWIVYGALRSDWVLMLANAVSLLLVGAIAGCKIRDLYS
jgi:MtN3 and saliva related transmembrane protein